MGCGAHDNACGTIGVIEMARILSAYESQRTLWFVFCNEEHVPWTSETVAAGVASAGLDVRAVLNVDSIAGRSDEAVAAGRRTNSTRYTTDEGLELARRMAALNERYAIDIDNLAMAVQLSLAFVVDVDRNG